MPLYPETVLPYWSFAVMVTEKTWPAIVELGAETAKCVALPESTVTSAGLEDAV